MDRTGVVAVGECDVPGQRVVDALLRFDREHVAPACHVLRPCDGEHADIRADIQRLHTVTEMLAPQVEQRRRKVDLVGLVTGVFEQLNADAEGRPGWRHLEVETVDDHCAVVGRSQNEADTVMAFRHFDTLLQRNISAQGSQLITSL
jgi:hypothetical protein